jgi:hypothetical protein
LNLWCDLSLKAAANRPSSMWRRAFLGGMLLEYGRSGTSKQVRVRKPFEPMSNL